MIKIKTKNQIESMKKGGSILAEVMREVGKEVKPGITELEIEKVANKLIIEKGGFPGFKKVPGYNFATCLATNDVIVHGLPKNQKLKEGDIIGVDIGVFYDGLHTDMAETFRVGEVDPEISKFLETGKKALNEAIKQAKAGNRIGHISMTIQDIVEEAGYSIVKNLVGHGVGEELHEEPEIPGFLYDKIEKTPLLQPGMTIAIEVIYNMGTNTTKYDKDGWTIRTKDGSLSGLFERSVLITEKEPIILTN